MIIHIILFALIQHLTIVVLTNTIDINTEIVKKLQNWALLYCD